MPRSVAFRHRLVPARTVRRDPVSATSVPASRFRIRSWSPCLSRRTRTRAKTSRRFPRTAARSCSRAFFGARVAAGARLAEPGEFTLRAFLHAKLDLVQAEAVADLIDAVTPLQARAAFDQLEGTLTCRIGSLEAALFDLIAKLEASLDFPDEGYHFIEPRDVATSIAAIIGDLDALLARAARGRMLREGAQVAIVGAPNVGKSSLFNALLNANRAIVTPVPGTTRDLLTERADIRGMSVVLVDTAGIRETDSRSRTGRRARERAARRVVADLVLVVLDRSRRR